MALGCAAISRQDASAVPVTIGVKGGTSLENCHRGRPVRPAPLPADGVFTGGRRVSAVRRGAGRPVQPMGAGGRLRRRHQLARAQRPAGCGTGRFPFSGFSGRAAPHRRRHPHLLCQHGVLHHPPVPPSGIPAGGCRVDDAAGAVGLSHPAAAAAVGAVRRCLHRAVRCGSAAAVAVGCQCLGGEPRAGAVPAGSGAVPYRLRLVVLRLPRGRYAGGGAADGRGEVPVPRLRRGGGSRGRSDHGSVHRRCGTADRSVLRRDGSRLRRQGAGPFGRAAGVYCRSHGRIYAA